MTPAHLNPFRVDRLHALPFDLCALTWPALMQRLEGFDFRAAVVGPHGSGKTALLHALEPRLAAAGYRPRLMFRNRGGGWTMPAAWREALATLERGDVLLVDGYDHLGPLERRRLRVAARAAAGLIVTAHHRCCLPTLIRTRTDPALLGRIVEHLLGEPLPDATIADVYQRRRGNLRDALRELYDREGNGTLRAGR